MQWTSGSRTDHVVEARGGRACARDGAGDLVVDLQQTCGTLAVTFPLMSCMVWASGWLCCCITPGAAAAAKSGRGSRHPHAGHLNAGGCAGQGRVDHRLGALVVVVVVCEDIGRQASVGTSGLRGTHSRHAQLHSAAADVAASRGLLPHSRSVFGGMSTVSLGSSATVNCTHKGLCLKWWEALTTGELASLAARVSHRGCTRSDTLAIAVRKPPLSSTPPQGRCSTQSGSSSRKGSCSSGGCTHQCVADEIQHRHPAADAKHQLRSVGMEMRDEAAPCKQEAVSSRSVPGPTCIALLCMAR